ncbi:hypothetical protein EPR50_G00205850 [Perca flavescens]|uniref:Uncharacterized protein n=1 Tax=Perca flavescens TaxID=8167 RepID=A0A484CB87_PERFV|nr:hypothetical protein EPR50_G00205850 [Perca flavescens]
MISMFADPLPVNFLTAHQDEKQCISYITPVWLRIPGRKLRLLIACIIKRIRRPHLEENSTASRRGGGSAARRRPQPSSLHNCGFSDFSQIQEYSSSHAT